jgi:hypothetical protein
MHPNLFQGDLAKTHQWELAREAEHQRLAASASLSPKRNIVRLVISKLGVLLVGLGTWMKRVERVEQSPKPVTGNL